MTQSEQVQETPRTATEICQNFELGEDARALLNDKLSAGSYFRMLRDRELYKDALRFVAYLLPKREAVWWGSLCVWRVLRPKPGDKDAIALQAAVRWVLAPTEENRRAAEAPGKAAGAGAPAGAVALAAFWSGGSMSLPNLPEVPPPPFLTAKVIAGAVLSAAAQEGQTKITDIYQQFLALGVDVDNGSNRWE